MDRNFNMTGFTRIIQKHGMKDEISLMLQARSIFDRMELDTVIEGQRTACTDHVIMDSLPDFLDLLNSKGLVFTPLKKSGFYQGFGHTHKKVNVGDSYFWYGCVTRSYEDGQEFKEADKVTDHKAIGKMLGYPDCCTEYFVKSFDTNYDPVWLGYDNISGVDPAVNILLRYFGIRIVSHLTCSPYCEQTLQVAKQRLQLVKPDIRDWALELLNSPMTWDSYHGVVEIDTPNFLGVTHTFPLNEHRIVRWNK